MMAANIESYQIKREFVALAGKRMESQSINYTFEHAFLSVLLFVVVIMTAINTLCAVTEGEYKFRTNNVRVMLICSVIDFHIYLCGFRSTFTIEY